MQVLKIRGLKRRYSSNDLAFSVPQDKVRILDAELARYADQWNNYLNGLRYRRGGSKEQFNNPCGYLIENVDRIPRDYRIRYVDDSGIRLTRMKFLEVPATLIERVGRTDIWMEDIYPYFMLAQLFVYENMATRLEIMGTDADTRVLVNPNELYKISDKLGIRT